MEEIQALMQGFSVALVSFNIKLMFVGILLGVIIGVLFQNGRFGLRL